MRAAPDSRRPRQRPSISNGEIRPILSDNCFQCHGPDSAARQAGLRLDRKEAALEARPNGAPIVPGKSADSLLYQRISDPDAGSRMPPAESHKRLTAAQIALLKRWIDGGAPWKEHWAFQTPVKPKPPAVHARRVGAQPDRPFHPREA